MQRWFPSYSTSQIHQAVTSQIFSRLIVQLQCYTTVALLLLHCVHFKSEKSPFENCLDKKSLLRPTKTILFQFYVVPRLVKWSEFNCHFPQCFFVHQNIPFTQIIPLWRCDLLWNVYPATALAFSRSFDLFSPMLNFSQCWQSGRVLAVMCINPCHPNTVPFTDF